MRDKKEKDEKTSGKHEKISDNVWKGGREENF